MGVLALYTTPACPADCGPASQLPGVAFEECAESVIQNKSQIDYILMVKPDPADPTQPITKPTDVTDLAAWNLVIDQTADDKVRKCIGIGDMPEPESDTRTISKGRILTTNKTFTINFDIDDASDENYEATRELECNPTVFIWAVTRGQKLYGGPNGMRCSVSKAVAPLNRGEDAYETFLWQFQWESTGHPPRAASPFA